MFTKIGFCFRKTMNDKGKKEASPPTPLLKERGEKPHPLLLS